MKTLKNNLIILVGFLLLLSCQKDSIKGSGNVIEEQRSVNSFNKIEIRGVFNVIISQANTESLTVFSDDNLMNLIETYVINNTLYLELDEDINLKEVTKMEIKVSVVDLTKLNFTGVGNILASNLHVEYFELDNTGVGDIEITGSSNYFYINNNGVGDLDALGFSAQHVNIESSGVGKVKVYAEKTIAINTSGVGDILYKGDPEVTELKNTGAGKVTKVD